MWIEPSFAFAVSAAWLVLLIGVALRAWIPVLRRYHIPASVLGGLLALVVGPRVAGGGLVLSEELLSYWDVFPGWLINVVFACLFLGKRIPNPRHVWRTAGAQAMFGQSLAWGQYALGLLLAVTVLAPFFGTDPMAGTLIEMGFEGGHGVASGLEEAFVELGFPEGVDIAEGLATVGIVGAVLIGTLEINLRGGAPEGDQDISETSGKTDQRSDELTDSLALHLGIVALAIGIGWLMLRGLVALEEAFWIERFKVLSYVPLFPLAMIGGLVVQLVARRLGWTSWIQRPMVARIGDTALDLTVLTAIGSLSVGALSRHWEAFSLLSLLGITWCVFGFHVLAPRMIPDAWFERGIGDFGQSMGMTATGLLLMKMADPEGRTDAVQSFGYKQLLFEPFVGGGIVTSAALPLVHHFGPVVCMAAAAGIWVVITAIGLLYFGRMRD